MPDSVLPLARGLHTGFAIALAGAWFFRAAIAPVRMGGFHDAAFAGAIITGIAWLLVQAAQFTGAAGLGETLASLPDVVAGTQFGRAALASLALLVAAWIVGGRGESGRRSAAAVLLALLGLLARVLAGHAMALEDGVLLAALALHLVAAALWLGALPPLWVAIGQDRAAAARIVRRFSRIGVAAVLVLAATGFVQGLGLIGDAPGLFGTAYGLATLLKTALFLALIGLALANRLVLTPALPTSLATLRRSIVLETGIGIVVIVIAAWLGTLPPGLHIQPDWPFPFRIAARPAFDEPDVPADVFAISALVLAALASAGLLWAAWRWQRLRWIAPVLIAPAWLAAILLPRIQVLDAVPTSFRTMPEGFTAASILRGEVLAATQCPGCAVILDRLADPDQPRLTDGEVFWSVRRAVDMPDTADTAAWDLAAYLRAAAAGREIDRDGAWADRIRAPDLGIRCGNTLARLSDLRGEVLLVTTGYAQKVEGARVVNLDPARLSDAGCAALTAEAQQAYGLIAGLPRPAQTLGHWFLVDGNGWIRGTGVGAPEILAEAVHAAAATPLSEARAHH